MSVKLRSGLRNLELHFWWEQAQGEERVVFQDRLAARGFLARLATLGHGLALHRLAAADIPLWQRSDAAVLDRLAWWIVSGKLRVAASPVEPLIARDREEEEHPAEPPRAAPKPAREEPPPIEEPLPPVPVDLVAQAEALRRAAAQGAPFCEECEEARRSREEEQEAPEPEQEPSEAEQEAAIAEAQAEERESSLDEAAQAETLIAAAAKGAPFCEECERAKQRAAAR